MGAHLSVMPWGTLRAPARATQAARSSRQTAGGLHRRAVPLSHEAPRLILSPPAQPPNSPRALHWRGGARAACSAHPTILCQLLART